MMTLYKSAFDLVRSYQTQLYSFSGQTLGIYSHAGLQIEAKLRRRGQVMLISCSPLHRNNPPTGWFLWSPPQPAALRLGEQGANAQHHSHLGKG